MEPPMKTTVATLLPNGKVYQGNGNAYGLQK